MCGIAGSISDGLSPPAREAAIAGMCAAMRHRGPDDEGTVTVGPATLGMRRLAIFDPRHGRQPMATPDGRLSLVFNGAIYNFRELRRELASGWSFRTECDTEVLLAAFARWGAGCLPRLRGMFAFAVWNRETRTLFVARDAFGIKPLYYRHDAAGFHFASELNALLAARLFPGEVDPDAVAAFLAWQAVPAPGTIYRGVLSLRPGECSTYAEGTWTPNLWWRFPLSAAATGSAAPPPRPSRATNPSLHAARGNSRLVALA